MATATIYAAANSGFHVSMEDSFDYTTGFTTLFSDSSNSSNALGTFRYSKASLWRTWQRFDTFDVSSLSGTSVSAASLVYYTAYGTVGPTQDYYSLKYNWASINASEYRTPTQLQSLTNYATASNNYEAAGADVSFIGSSTLKSDISSLATLKIVSVLKQNYDDTSYQGGLSEIATTSYSPSTSRPRLIVTYTAGAVSKAGWGLILK
jgi:hypothetical protein